MPSVAQTETNREDIKPLHILPATSLQKKNKHPLDLHIQFFDEGHIYDVDGRQDYMSCTTFVHQFFDDFDADAIIAKMMSNQIKWKKKWTYKGNHASHHGTILHGCI